MKLRLSLPRPKNKLLLVRRVVGDSMVPTLAPGGIIIGVWHRRAKVGDVVIIKHQGLEKTKRITQMAGRRIFVEGDNAMQSTDSRQFGWIDQNSVLARVIWPRTGNWPKGRSSGML